MKTCTLCEQIAVSQMITVYSRVGSYLWVTGEVGILAVG